MTDGHEVKRRTMMLWDHSQARPRTHFTLRRHIALCSCGWRSRPLRDPDVADRLADVHQGADRRLYRPSRRP